MARRPSQQNSSLHPDRAADRCEPHQAEAMALVVIALVAAIGVNGAAIVDAAIRAGWW